ncbi:MULTISPECIES: hypothetical protein [unclassified Pseudomonas]|uniref:hypothetical protein n=1 Tax=unclassified Pseudomonas TaxID=196821 RepID=UPI000C2FE06C|nr:MULTISPECIES: hypothetical protein [unclassified Pseudomonas]MCU1737981.1 hypothetical protein [Pseudomonas sp. 20S_6.2_Bac1]
MKKTLIALVPYLFLMANVSHAATTDTKRTPFTGVDISGTYSCIGNDIHDGDFKSVMTLTLDSQYSSGKSGSFKAKVEADQVLIYTGSIVSNGKALAMDFANVDASKKDFGVALATVSEPKKGKFKIDKFYYEPDYMGGSNGFESCTLK